MTKHITLEDTETLVTANMKALSASPLEIYGTPCAKTIRKVSAETSVIKPRTTRTRIESIKTRLNKTMRKLYNIESDNAPDKPLPADLGVNLYQMEKY